MSATGPKAIYPVRFRSIASTSRCREGVRKFVVRFLRFTKVRRQQNDGPGSQKTARRRSIESAAFVGISIKLVLLVRTLVVDSSGDHDRNQREYKAKPDHARRKVGALLGRVQCAAAMPMAALEAMRCLPYPFSGSILADDTGFSLSANRKAHRKQTP
jgi:hypothetical protein